MEKDGKEEEKVRGGEEMGRKGEYREREKDGEGETAFFILFLTGTFFG